MPKKILDFGVRIYPDGTGDTYNAKVNYEELVSSGHEFLFRFIALPVEDVITEAEAAFNAVLNGKTVDISSVMDGLKNIHPLYEEQENALILLARTAVEFGRDILPSDNDIEKAFFGRGRLFSSMNAGYWLENAGTKMRPDKGSLYSLAAAQTSLRSIAALLMDDTFQSLGKYTQEQREAVFSAVYGERGLATVTAETRVVRSRQARGLEAMLDFTEGARVRLCADIEGLGRTRAKEVPADVVKALDGLTSTAEPSLEVTYKVSCLEDIFDIELSDMLTSDVRVRRCKSCGRYFVYTDENQDYCTIVEAGTSCWRRNLEDEAQQLYRKAYKTHKMRESRGTLSAADEKAWEKRAAAAKEELLAGRITKGNYLAVLKK